MDNIVLEGGGVKGIAYAGVFSALSAHNKYDGISNVLGVSAGAIAAVFLAIGMTTQEVEQALKAIEFEEFKDDSFGAVRDVYRFVSKYGKHRGDYFTHWLGDIVEAYTGSRDCTFKELAEVPKSKNLFVAATCLDEGKQVVFSKDTHPSMSIVLAVRASMAIPFFFTPVDYGGSLYMDGGVLNNYPINFFDGKGGKTIGVRLDTTEEVQHTKRYKHDNVLMYATSTFQIIYDRLQTRHISKRDWANSIIVDCGNTSAMAFDIKEVEKERLIDSGWKAAMAFLGK